METKLLRLDQLLERLPISRRQAYREMAEGRLPFIQHGSRRLFEETAIDEFVATIKAEAADDHADRAAELIELIDEDGRIDVAKIPEGTTLADLEAAKRVVAGRLALAG